MKLMVLDGNSIVNRAFYGVRLLSTGDGLYTNAVYGFLTILQKLLSEQTPDAVCVTFDLKAPTFRHLQYEGYKAQRKAMPEELAVQIPVLKDVLDAMNIRRYELSGYEADDLIGTISARCEQEDWQCLAVTGDKDSFQLISEKTHVLHVKSRMGQTETKEYDPEAFRQEYGFAPEKMVDLKALMGDASDNIPGVAGIGEKTALDLIRRFGSLEAIYGDLEKLDIRDSVRKKLAAGREAAKMSYELATICREAPLAFAPGENLCRPVDGEKLYGLFKRLEFTRLIERYGLTAPEKQEEPAIVEGTCTSVLVSDEESFAAMRQELTQASAPAGVYLEEDLSLAVLCGEETGYILDQAQSGEKFSEYLRFAMGEGVKKAGHNVKDRMRLLLQAGYPAEGWQFDTAVAAYLLEPTEHSYELGKLTQRYCGFTMPDGADANGQFSLLDDAVARYTRGLVHASSVMAVQESLEKRLEQLGMTGLFYEIEMPLCRVLAEMERDGVLVDRGALSEFGRQLRGGEEELQRQIYEMAGEEFNINSPKQLSTILFEKLMLPAPKKTKTGYATNVEALEKLKNKHPIIEKILQYRELTKLRSTYTDGLVKEIREDGRIHTNFQMTVTATGRLSSTAPNLQNIPIRRALGGEIRKMFVAGPGCVLVDADYSQIELRLLAHLADDETMRQAFLSGEDIHRVTASQVFDIPLEQVTPLQRSRAKAVNFGIVYGISPFSLAQDIGVSVAEAKQYMDSYLSRYHGVREYMKRVVEKARQDGYVSTLYGRRRPLPELQSSNFNIRSFGERVALNMPVQGTAADVMKIAMLRVSDRLHREKLRARLLLQIHDELIVECPEEEAETVREILCREMEQAATLSVPLSAEAGTGHSWYEAKE